MAKGASAFSGFPPEAFAFLRDLAANNDRIWFQLHKAEYERAVLAPFRLLLAELIGALAVRGVNLTGDPAKAIFRIHRDVRFSADKRPYKTHAGAVLSPDGGKAHGNGILYIHIAPEGCFTAAGFYLPEREVLGALREAIYTEPARFRAIVDDLAAHKLPLSTEGGLTRMPKGYEDAAGTEAADWLKLKSYIVEQKIDATSKNLVADLAAFAETTQNLLAFGRQAMTVLDPTDLKRLK